MILTRDELAAVRRPYGLVDGCFDPLHEGHLRYFEAAARSGMPLVCNVQSDAYIVRVKRRPPLLPENQRAAVLGALRPLAHVHICRTSTEDILDHAKPSVYFKGADWKRFGVPPAQVEICARHGIAVQYLDTAYDSSTKRAQSFIEAAGGDFKSQAFGFEERVLAQRAVASPRYDGAYFTDPWRASGETYSVDRRREIEGRNPNNIVEVFAPKRVLDVGCGPGALMLFLHELGVEVWGLDVSDAAKELAPAPVREHILTGTVTEYREMGLDFDLVICRELLEHLTVLQIREAVRAMARYSRRYIYVTTRYHKNPMHLLDVSDDLETDPTHITVLNKEFMRTLFVLEGLRSRPDLERRLDWKGYGRVLVFEKAGYP